MRAGGATEWLFSNGQQFGTTVRQGPDFGRQKGATDISRAFRMIEGLRQRRVFARWRQRLRRAGSVPLSIVRAEMAEAEALRAVLDDYRAIAGMRLVRSHIGLDTFSLPAGTDWVWRPRSWCAPLAVPGLAGVASQARLGDEVTVFHDCRDSALTIRQQRNRGDDDLAPFALRLDVLHFDGSFLSLVLDLPEAASIGLQKRHLLRLEIDIACERPIEIFARLNVRHGPNVEQIVRELPAPSGRVVVEFDLAYTKLNEKRVERAWLDLIFDQPAMNEITVRDLVVARSPRAEI